MPTAAQNDLAEGLATLDRELGERYVLVASGLTFIARIERNRPRDMSDGGGMIRETVLHAREDQDAFADELPDSGDTIRRPDNKSARLARISPGELAGMLMLILADEFS